MAVREACDAPAGGGPCRYTRSRSDLDLIAIASDRDRVALPSAQREVAIRPNCSYEQSAIDLNSFSGIALFFGISGCERKLLMPPAMKKDVQLPGVSLHLIRRGINRTTVFGDHEDFELFLALLEASSRCHDVSVHAYALMTNHYHVLATPNQPNAASRMIQDLNREYVRHFNRRYGRIGTLWTGRLSDIPITDERYWLTCMRYIEHNPVRARMVSAPDEYVWSTFRLHALGEPIDWIVQHETYLALGATSTDRQMAYRALSEAALNEAELVRQRNGLSSQRDRSVELAMTSVAT